MHIADGTYRKDRHGSGQPQPLAGIPARPRHLTKAARKVWDELVEALGNAGILTRADANCMAAYCEAMATWLDAKVMIAEGGAVLVDDSTDRMYRNPYVAIASEAVGQMQTLGSSLGLNPAARAKLHAIPPPVEPDTTDRFFHKREETA
jgi:P27 family predicted phage terminase small subunit